MNRWQTKQPLIKNKAVLEDSKFWKDLAKSCHQQWANEKHLKQNIIKNNN